MRYWINGLPISPDVQTNTPALAKYWFYGLPLGRLNFTPPPPPTTGSAALPTGITRARLDFSEWFPTFRRSFGVPDGAVVVSDDDMIVTILY